MAEPLPTTMTEAQVQADTSVKFVQVPVPTLTSPLQMLVRVHAAGCNPKDWKMPAGLLQTIGDCANSGDDVSGVVVAVGSSVRLFQPGDRVAGLHELGAPGGAYADYAVLHEQASWRLDADMAHERAAGVPMASLMASIGLFASLRVSPGPWEQLPPDSERPLLVYGAASAVGSMAVKIAVAMGIHPVICVAGGGRAYVESLIDPSKGDAVVDYRNGSEKTVEGLRAALGGRKLMYAFDAVSMKDSFANVAAVLDSDRGRVTLVLPQKRPEFKPEQQTNTMAGILYKRLTTRDPGNDVGHLGEDVDGPEFGHMVSSTIGRWHANGKLKENPYEVVGGWDALEGALKRLREGKVSATKLVVKVRDD